MTRIPQLITAAFFFILFTQPLTAKGTFRFLGYNGGMMLHTGYIQSSPFTVSHEGAIQGTYQIKGAARGIGGAVRFLFGTEQNNLRIGSEGYSSTVNYSPRPSYAHTGWGGITLDYLRETKSRVHPFIGAMIGGGGTKNHLLTDCDVSDYQTEKLTAIRQYTFFAVAPYAGIEISITKAMRFIVKLDYLIDASGNRADFSKGIRIYGGIVFNRLMKK